MESIREEEIEISEKMSKKLSMNKKIHGNDILIS
jgi:hypothetical protein